MEFHRSTPAKVGLASEPQRVNISTLASIPEPALTPLSQKTPPARIALANHLPAPDSSGETGTHLASADCEESSGNRVSCLPVQGAPMPQKNTFVHYDVQDSMGLGADAAGHPTKSAPPDMMQFGTAPSPKNDRGRASQRLANPMPPVSEHAQAADQESMHTFTGEESIAFISAEDASPFCASRRDLPQKNTFIHYQVGESSMLGDSFTGHPTVSAPPAVVAGLPLTSNASTSSTDDSHAFTGEESIELISGEDSVKVTPNLGRPAVLVSQKNTFVHYEIEDSSRMSSEWPTRTAPPDMLQTMFHTTLSAKQLEHVERRCTPCAYYLRKADGCRKGEDCEFCHLCDRGEIRRRKREKVKVLKAQAQAAEAAGTSVGFNDLAQPG